MIGERRKADWKNALIRTTRVAVLWLDAHLLNAPLVDGLFLSDVSSGASAMMILPLCFVPLDGPLSYPLILIVTGPLCLHRPAVTNGAVAEEESLSVKYLQPV